jgi:hypothetical protein
MTIIHVYPEKPIVNVLHASSFHIMDFGPELEKWHWGVWNSGPMERWECHYWFRTRDREATDHFAVESGHKPTPGWLANLCDYALARNCDWIAMNPDFDIIEGFPINPDLPEHAFTDVFD